VERTIVAPNGVQVGAMLVEELHGGQVSAAGRGPYHAWYFRRVGVLFDGCADRWHVPSL